MKRVFLFLALLLLTFSAAFSQSNKKLVVMVTWANWCPPCRANEGKITNELIPVYAVSKDVIFVINDVTNKRTKNKSEANLKATGVYEVSKNEIATGVISLIKLVTGKVINYLKVTQSAEQIEKTINETNRSN